MIAMTLNSALKHGRLKSRRGGFTLIEILCVVIIIGIAAAIVVPEISSRDDLKASAAARTLTADLMYVQNRAVTVQKSHAVVFDVDTGRYTVYQLPGPTVVKHPLDKTDYIREFGAGGTDGLDVCALGSADFADTSGVVRHALVFDELGAPWVYNPTDGTTARLRSGAITLSCGAISRTLRVEPFTGQLKVE
jgi:prepilin-type N-terminal cleavage/methylation domain-containing protein